MADPGPGHQLQHRVEHAEARPQHGHDDDAVPDAAAVSRAERSLNAHGSAWHVAGRLRREEEADAHGHAPERFGRRVGVSQRGESVMDERMLDEVNWHRDTIQKARSLGVRSYREITARRTENQNTEYRIQNTEYVAD